MPTRRAFKTTRSNKAIRSLPRMNLVELSHLLERVLIFANLTFSNILWNFIFISTHK